MLRIAKLTDYAIVVLAHLAREAHVCVHAAPAVSEATGVPQPTVEKVLKQLARGGLLVSSRGIHGGYSLARDPSAISVAQVIDAIEGPVGLTACSGVQGEACADEGRCQVSVEKVLKQLARGGLLVSSRGIHGGYSLARDPAAISVAEVIDAIEGPVGLTACSGVQGEACADEGRCQVSGHWASIHDAVRGALEAVSILDLSRPVQSGFRRASAAGDALALRAGK